LLREKRVSQIGRPLDVACQSLNDVWSNGQGLDAGIPRLLGHSVRQCLVLQIFVSIHPLLKLDDFKRIRRSSQRLSKEWIWIKRDRRHQRIQLIIRKLGSLFRVRGRRGHNLRVSPLRQCCGGA
jgi:hypothetical protein